MRNNIPFKEDITDVGDGIINIKVFAWTWHIIGITNVGDEIINTKVFYKVLYELPMESSNYNSVEGNL